MICIAIFYCEAIVLNTGRADESIFVQVFIDKDQTVAPLYSFWHLPNLPPLLPSNGLANVKVKERNEPFRNQHPVHLCQTLPPPPLFQRHHASATVIAYK